MATEPTPISALPTAPSRNDPPATFNSRADALVAALSTFVSQCNAIATNVYNNAAEAFTKAGEAASSASAASGSASTASTAASTATGAASTATSARDTTLGYRNAAEGFKDDAEAAAVDARGYRGFSAFCSGTPLANEVVLSGIAPYDMVLDEGASKAIARTAPEAGSLFSILKNGFSVGTITFRSTDPDPTVGAVSLPFGSVQAGDLITIVATFTPDSALADIAFQLRE